MIQPLKSQANNWSLHWVDLDEPLPTGKDWFLPTLVVVCDASGTPLAPPEILEELDQPRVESLLYKLFDDLGSPDRLSIAASDDWDPEGWQAFSSECKVEIRFHNPGSRPDSDLKALTQTLVMRVGQDPEEPAHSRAVAAGLVRTALRVRSQAKKNALLERALASDPECAAARIELADIGLQSGDYKNCQAAYEEVLRLEAPRLRGKSPAWWTNRETRPFLRALYGKAMTLWHLGDYASASEPLEDLLRINPIDNQGARFLVPMLHLLADAPEKSAAYFANYARTYPNDYPEPSFLFGWALSNALEGRESEAREKYAGGILKNIYLAPMLLEQDEPPRTIWMPNDRAEPNYAAEFIDSYAILWDREPGALRILREVHQEMLGRIAKIIAHREKMADFQDQRYDPEYKRAWADLVAEDELLTLP